jgi:hypothetical protein
VIADIAVIGRTSQSATPEIDIVPRDGFVKMAYFAIAMAKQIG